MNKANTFFETLSTTSTERFEGEYANAIKTYKKCKTVSTLLKTVEAFFGIATTSASVISHNAALGLKHIIILTKTAGGLAFRSKILCEITLPK